MVVGKADEVNSECSPLCGEMNSEGSFSLCEKQFIGMSKSVLSDKSIKFAARIIKLNNFLVREQKEYIISKQIVRSATSIGANISEANYAQSNPDFVSKLSIALKETAETEYWIKLLGISEIITEAQYKSLLRDCLDIKRMLVASINTSKENR